MKCSIARSSVLTLLLCGQTAFAKEKYSDFAHVVSAEPVYQTIEHSTPRETCWTETVGISETPSHAHSGTPAIIGGLIGGAIGHELGRGKDNRKLGAVLGSVLGLSVGHDIQRRQRADVSRKSPYIRYEEQERCQLTHRIEREQVLKGYRVSYRYHGQDYSTFMHEHPGNTIRVAVSVQPVHR